MAGNRTAISAVAAESGVRRLVPPIAPFFARYAGTTLDDLLDGLEHGLVGTYAVHGLGLLIQQLLHGKHCHLRGASCAGCSIQSFDFAPLDFRREPRRAPSR